MVSDDYDCNIHKAGIISSKEGGLDAGICARTMTIGREGGEIVEERSGELVLNTHEAMYEVLDRAQETAMQVIVGEFY